MAIAGAIPQISTDSSHTTHRDSSQRRYRPDLDGLRAVAILSVVLGHAHVPPLTGGFTGVDIFFVLSGYLIGGQIHTDLRIGNFNYLEFYRRRAKRILPAFFAVLIVTLASGLILLSPLELEKLARSAFAATLSGSNILFWHSANYFDTRSELNPLLMTWSLGVEEQFYAVIPLILVRLTRLRRRWTLPAIAMICAASFTFAAIALPNHPSLVFYMLPARAWELGLGIALAIAESNDDCSVIPMRLHLLASAIGSLLMLAPLFLLNAASQFPGAWALPSTLGAAIVIAAPSNSINRRILAPPPLAFVGRISYSWYLWHWPLLAFLRIVYGSEPPAIALFAAIALSLALAVLSYFLVEQPARKSQRQAGLLLTRYAAVCAALLSVSAALWLTRGLPQRYPALAQIESASTTLYSDECLADDGASTPNLSPRCVEPSGSMPIVALWGDSHAAALAPALRQLAQAQGYAFMEFAKASCPPILGAAHYIPRHPLLAAECSRYNSAALHLLQQNPRIRIVILSAAWAGYLHRDMQDGWLVNDDAPQRKMPDAQTARNQLEQSLASAIQSLQSADKQVIVFSEVPTFDFEPSWKISTAQIPARRALAALLGVNGADDPGTGSAGDAENAAAAIKLLDKVAAAVPGVTLVDLRSPFCDQSAQCRYRSGSTLLYIDNNHLSPQGAQFALRSFSFPPLARTTGSPAATEQR